MVLRVLQCTARQRRAADVQGVPHTQASSGEGTTRMGRGARICGAHGLGSELGDCSDAENSGTKAVLDKDKEAAARHILGMMQVLGANAPLEFLKAAGLH